MTCVRSAPVRVQACRAWQVPRCSVAIPKKLNATPMQRETRKFFYRDVAEAMERAVNANQQRLSLRLTIPETNPEQDVFRIGTLLELARELATTLASDGKRVKVSVQQALGAGVFQGMPLSLSGVRRIMERMDWGDAGAFVGFGEVGADQIDDACDYYILIAPQNVVGNTIMTNLLEMVEAAEAKGKVIVLLNPLLKDIPSHSSVMGVRGRKDRLAFAASFTPAYHFRLLYMSSQMAYPIMGALRHCFDAPWEVYKRVELGRRDEEYQLVGEFDTEPDGSQLTPLFRAKQETSGAWWR